jgi:hypothetical protein
LVVIAAIDCVTARVIEIIPKPITGVLTVIAVGSLPTANLLALNLILIVAVQGRWRAFQIGFTAAGSIALLGFLGWAIMTPNVENIFLDTSEPLFEWIGQGHDREPRPCLHILIDTGILFALPLVPQGLIALMGGGLFAQFRHRPDPKGGDEAVRRRLGLGRIALALVICAMPALMIEWEQLRVIVPRIGRLKVGSEAVVDRRNGPIGWASTAVVGLTSRSRSISLALFDDVVVRIESDQEPDKTMGYQTGDNSVVYVDERMVRVTLLEGPMKGNSIDLERCWLRPR